jgi:hypothetical protein
MVPPHPSGTVPQSDSVGQLPVIVHPQELGPAFPPPQVLGGSQLLGHVTGLPQLLVAGPHSFPLHVVATGSATQLQRLLVQV